jgi:SAM-dependent methyltransferase
VSDRGVDLRDASLHVSGDTTLDACPVCGKPLVAGRRTWYRRCPACRFLASDLHVAINSALDGHVEEAEREKGLFTLRQANFVRILDRMESCLGGRPSSLLEVGCAHGWFMEAAETRGYTTTGLEPDKKFHVRSSSNGLNIIKGYFPGDLDRNATFDVIVFNDVFEHLPNPHEAMGSVAERLNPGGALVINIPNSEGFFYRTASMLDGLGIPGPLRRMWQVNFPSPHLSYFNPASLALLAGRYGLAEVHRSILSSITVDGLWHRLRHVRHLQPANVVVSAGVWMAVAGLSPLISRLPSDVSLQIFRKAG